MDIRSTDHLIIFVKNPELGKVKTRLAKDVGDFKALEVYRQLLHITKHACEGMNCSRNVFYSEGIIDDDWDTDRFDKFVQIGSDLGERMQNAMEQAFALGARKAVVIGSDCPQITKKVIDEAFEKLDAHDAVIGPASDGGYYLIGLRSLHPQLFMNKRWSTETVLSDTVQDLKSGGLTFFLLEELSDIDSKDDLYLLI
jgi:hypothetical protein